MNTPIIPSLPDRLETLEDYRNVADTFVLPFFADRSEKVVKILEELHADLAKGEIEQEKINLVVNQILDTISFADPKSPLFPFFQSVAELEARLIEEGLLTDEA